MSSAVRPEPKAYEVFSNSNSAVRREQDLEDNNNGDTPTIKPTINDVESLKKGVIKTRGPCTILLVGETGVGKSSVVELISNVLRGNETDHYDLNVLDRTNEQGGPNSRSRTEEVHLYEITSKNGAVVRILDTPGLADTRGIGQDEPHKQSVAAQIRKHVSSATAVLVLANGTVPRGTGALRDPLATLSAILPDRNTAFVFTNVANSLSCNYCEDTLPETLISAPQFQIDNPIALHKKYLTLKDAPGMRKRSAELHKAVKASEQNVLETLVELFDWLNGREPQPMTGVTPFYDEKPQGPKATAADARAHAPRAKKAKNSAGTTLLAGSARVLSSLGMGRDRARS